MRKPVLALTPLRFALPLLVAAALLPARDATAVVGANVNVSSDPNRVHSTASVALDRANPLRLIAACNQINAEAQMLFASSDGGMTWTKVEMALGGATFHTNPGVGWDAEGTGYSSALGVVCLDPACTSLEVQVQLTETSDGGQNWSLPTVVATAANNERDLLAANHQTGTTCDNLVCIAWTEKTSSQDNIHCACSPRGAGPWTDQVVASGPFLTGAAPVFGPGGEIYVIWEDVRLIQINQSGYGVSTSTDCGRTWSPVSRFGPTRARYDVAIPAMCGRRAFMYPSIDVDRSNGTRRGTVYAVWTDAAPGASCPDFRMPCVGCPSGACATGCTTNVYFARSSDGGQNWSAEAVVHTDTPDTDQFQPWIAVDDVDGTIHVAWSDTRNDPARLTTDIYHRASSDGGMTWDPEERISSAASDETTAGADVNQYGEHSGLAVHQCGAWPVWTDRRSGGVEQIYTAHSAGCCTPGPPPPDIGNTIRARKSAPAMIPVVLQWTDLGGSEADYAVYRGTVPDPVATPPGRIGVSGGPDVVTYTDATPPAGLLFYHVRGLGPCGEEITTW